MAALHCIPRRCRQNCRSVTAEELADLLLIDSTTIEILDDAQYGNSGNSRKFHSEELVAWCDAFARVGFYAHLVERELVDGQWTFQPAHSSPTQSETDELPAFLPRFEVPGKKDTVRWDGPYPVYSDDVNAFIAIVTRICLAELLLCDRVIVSKMIQDEHVIQSASVSGLKMMLAFC